MGNEINLAKAVEYYLMGLNITEIAKRVGVSRDTIYSWMKRKEWTKKVNEYTRAAKSQAEDKIKGKTLYYMSELEKIADSTENDNTKVDIYKYLINRVLGTPTSKVETKVEDNTQQGIDINNALAKLKEMKESKE